MEYVICLVVIPTSFWSMAMKFLYNFQTALFSNAQNSIFLISLLNPEYCLLPKKKQIFVQLHRKKKRMRIKKMLIFLYYSDFLITHMYDTTTFEKTIQGHRIIKESFQIYLCLQHKREKKLFLKKRLIYRSTA